MWDGFVIVLYVDDDTNKVNLDRSRWEKPLVGEEATSGSDALFDSVRSDDGADDGVKLDEGDHN